MGNRQASVRYLSLLPILGIIFIDRFQIPEDFVK